MAEPPILIVRMVAWRTALLVPRVVRRYAGHGNGGWLRSSSELAGGSGGCGVVARARPCTLEAAEIGTARTRVQAPGRRDRCPTPPLVQAVRCPSQTIRIHETAHVVVGREQAAKHDEIV